jgi:hypothetical protein
MRVEFKIRDKLFKKSKWIDWDITEIIELKDYYIIVETKKKFIKYWIIIKKNQ